MTAPTFTMHHGPKKRHTRSIIRRTHMDCPGVALDLSTRLSSGHYEDSTSRPLARHHLSSLLLRGGGHDGDLPVRSYAD